MSKSVTYSKILTIYLFWWANWIAVQTAVILGLGFGWETALTDAAITQLIFALAGYTINASMRSYQPSIKNMVYLICYSIVLTLLSVFIQRWLLLQTLSGVLDYPHFLEKSLTVRGTFGWLMNILIATLTWFRVYVEDRKEMEKRKEDTARLAREAELSNLRLQLQPHFLFNSLNSISALAGSKPEQARKMIQQLSDFLRGTVKKDDAALVTLEEELQHLQLYLDIEKVRFGHRLKTDIQKSEESLNAKLPSLLLQPIVENAIKFGLYDTTGEITISITAKKENNMLILEVRNPFDPETATPRQGTGFGLSSVRRRLYLLYFRNDLLSTAQQENLFITNIHIPQAQ